MATGLAFSFASADLPDKRGPGDATRPVDAPAARAPSPASWGGGWGTHEAQEKFQGLFRDAPEYFLMLRLSFFALPAFFAVLMLAYHYGIPELCLF